MSVKLRDFIRNIRSCKTAAEERAVIAKECALIRTAFKEGDSTYRHRNVAKLLFIHMMGYPTHFGQLECMKLIASPRFVEKRIGYLGLHQVLDENTEVLMLVTNSIKNDIHHPSQYVNGLALCALGNVASSEMCRALAKEVEDACLSGNPYIRKKALLCAIRFVRKADDMSERFIPIVPSVFEDKNHSVLLAGCSLIGALIEADPKEALPQLRKLIPDVVQCLKRVVLMPGYTSSSEYDISGVTDPFLQVKLLKTLRLLLQGCDERNEEVCDVLSQVASMTESTKGAGNSVLLECATAIMSTNPDASLNSLGVSILGKFLQSKESNLRYVALSSLQQLIKIDIVAVQKHRTTIIECLKDADTSIRRRALEVLFHLINEKTIKQLFKELLALLVSDSPLELTAKEDRDFQRELVSKICQTVERYSPSRRWQVDSLIRVLSLAGDVAPPGVRNSFIFLLSLSPELQSYSVLKLFFAAKENPSQGFLKQVAIWAIGEYGDLLVAGKEAGPDGSLIHVSPSDVLTFLENCEKHGTQIHSVSSAGSPSIRSPTGSPASYSLLIGGSTLLENSSSGSSVTSELLSTCLIKLAARFPNEKTRIERMLKQNDASFSVELQQRCCEYGELLQSNWDETRMGILDRMPVPNDSFRMTLLQRPIGDLTIDEVPPLTNGITKSISSGRTDKSTDLLDLGDLLDVRGLPIPGGSSNVVIPAHVPISPAVVPSTYSAVCHTRAPVSSQVEDLLADLFGSTPRTNASLLSSNLAPTSPTNRTSENDLNSLL